MHTSSARHQTPTDGTSSMLRRTRIASRTLLGLSLGLLLGGTGAWATETEHTEFRILPAPGPLAIDGKTDDWDLSGSLFICSDVETYRDQYASWQSAMYDADNLYVLTRWIDETPMNNPGAPGSDMGFAGDCLQVRTVVRAGASADNDVGDDKSINQRVSHLDCWLGRTGRDIIGVQYGRRFDEGGESDLKAHGAKQAFVKNPDGKGYIQEIAIPWKMITTDGKAPAAGSSIGLTFEPNFGTASKMRITTKDLFRAGRTPDRVFTFGSPAVWGTAKVEAAGKVAPQPVRLSDGRTFPVTMEKGLPQVNWTGLYKDDKLEGFAKLELQQPEDGFVSLIIRNGDGQVVRNLLNTKFLVKGPHSVLWDGLTTPSDRKPGEPVAAGTYTWEAISHHGIGLSLVGWACNAGKAPFDSPGGNWGGDMGLPVAVDCDGDKVFLGWSAAEAGQAVVCTDYDGNVKWRHKRGGFGGAQLLAADQGILYVYDSGQGNTIYRLDAAKGDYSDWKGATQATLDLGAILGKDKPAGDEKRAPLATGMAAVNGKLLLSYGPTASWNGAQPSGDHLYILDGATGAVVKSVAVKEPNDLKVGADGKVYLVLGDSQVVTVDTETGATTPVVSGLHGARGVAADKDGNVFVGFAGDDQQVRIFDKSGKPVRTIGRKGGRPATGPWQADGMRQAQGLKVDGKGRLWAMEFEDAPRRVSVWDAASGALQKEYFGPTSYGASGGAVCPTDQYTMAGQGCEWKIAPDTGRATCVAVISRSVNWANARFGTGKDGRTYLAVGGGWAPHYPVNIFERIAAGQWKLRTTIWTDQESEGQAPHNVNVWSDRNDDQQRQDDEIRKYDVDLGRAWIDGWYLYFNQAMTFAGTTRAAAVTGWTACGAPEYDFTKAQALAGPADLGNRGGMGAQRGLVTQDGLHVLYNGHYGAEHSDFVCYDTRTGKQTFAYPNNYVGVHGGHSAPPPKVGLIRAAYDIIGTFPMPAPLGDIFVIGTDKGEWHLLSSTGYYVGKLFEGDAMKIRWPDEAIPGANMNTVPPGMGAEDFGGSVTKLADGSVHVQHGKTAFINSKVTGLDTVKVIGSGSLSIAPEDLAKAKDFQAKLLAGPSTAAQAAVFHKRSVRFTGEAQIDFASEATTFGQDGARISTWLAHDDAKLYVAWRVQDKTPWINGATGFENLYACGDTVDLQLGADPGADPKRNDPVRGDLRLSIGKLQGKNVAVIYRKVSDAKAPKTFFSGTRKEGYTMDEVRVLDGVDIQVKPGDGNYLVEAAIPLAALGVTAKPGLALRGDLGATFSDPAGTDTNLRVYWNNQGTGLVADEVEELLMKPAQWAGLSLE